MKPIYIPLIALSACGTGLCFAGIVNMVLRAAATSDATIGPAFIGLTAIGIACAIGYNAQKHL